MKEKNTKIIILLFVLLVIIIPFYESRRISIWQSQKRITKENIFSSFLVSYSNYSKRIKTDIGWDHFFNKENKFWLKLKKSPVVFIVSEEEITKANNKGSISIASLKTKKEDQNKASSPQKTKEKPLLRRLPKKTDQKSNDASFQASISQKEKITEKIIHANKAKKRFLIIGDSLVAVGGGLGETLERNLLKFNNTEIYRLGRVSSGLCRPDYFDWPLTTQSLISSYSPDLAIVVLGLNDAQAITSPNGRIIVSYLKFGTKKWKEEYKKRVVRVLEILNKKVKSIFWVGLPITRSYRFSEKLKILNSVYKETCQISENCHFIPIWQISADKNGNYTAYFLAKNGKPKLARTGDGIHFTYFGGDIISQEIIRNIKRFINLE